MDQIRVLDMPTSHACDRRIVLCHYLPAAASYGHFTFGKNSDVIERLLWEDFDSKTGKICSVSAIHAVFHDELLRGLTLEYRGGFQRQVGLGRDEQTRSDKVTISSAYLEHGETITRMDTCIPTDKPKFRGRRISRLSSSQLIVSPHATLSLRKL
jgi:hypothetical protein